VRVGRADLVDPAGELATGALTTSGGSAQSTSLGVAAGDSPVEVHDAAHVFGYFGGSARSTAEGRNAGASPVHVTSIATSGTYGEGASEATARGAGLGDVTVASQAIVPYSTSLESRTLARATATGEGISGRSVAHAAGVGQDFMAEARTRVAARAEAPVVPDVSTASAAIFRGESPLSSATDAAHMLAVDRPTAGAVAETLADGPEVAESFQVEDTVEFIGIAVARLAAGPGALAYTSAVEFSFDVPVAGCTENPCYAGSKVTPSSLVIGFVESSVFDLDFDSLRVRALVEGNSVLDETFTGGAEALAYLDDRPFVIATPVVDVDDPFAALGALDLRIEFELTTSAARSGFQQSVVVGVIAPEPSPALPMLPALVALLWARRLLNPSRTH
jgi:hypothetical protein